MDFGWHWKTLPVLLTVAEQFQSHKKALARQSARPSGKLWRREVRFAHSYLSNGSTGLPARVFAVVSFVELRLHPLLSPELLARPSRVFLKVVVPFRKIPIYRSFGALD